MYLLGRKIGRWIVYSSRGLAEALQVVCIEQVRGQAAEGEPCEGQHEKNVDTKRGSGFWQRKDGGLGLRVHLSRLSHF